MICQKCKQATASVCVSRVVDSRKVDIYLCRDCANEGTASELKSAFGLFDMLPSHFIFGGDYGVHVKKAVAGRCEVCGKGFDEIQKDGKLGCAKCYDCFRDKLRPIVVRIHRSAQHRGRGPQSYAADPGTPGAAGGVAGGALGSAAGSAAAPGSGAAPDYGAAASAPGVSGTGDAGGVSGAGTGIGTGGSAGTGGVGAGAAGGVGAGGRLAELQAALTAAIAAEEYERAAEIRDKIRGMEAGEGK